MKEGRKNAGTKFLLAAGLSASLLITGLSSASAHSFTDVASKYDTAIHFVTEHGAKGLTESKFGIDNEIKRVDAAILLAGILELDENNAPASGFTDVPSRGESAVNALKAAGITTGKTKTKFGAQSPISRGELAIWLERAFELTGKETNKFTDVSERYLSAISALVENNITNGISNTQYGVELNVKRGDFSVLTYKSFVSDEFADAEISEIKSINETTVQLKVNGQLSYVQPENFQFNNGLTVTKAKLTASGEETIVELTTSKQKVGTIYSLSVFGLEAPSEKYAFTLPTTENPGTPTNPGTPSEPDNPGDPGNPENPGGSYDGDDFSGTEEQPKVFNGNVSVNVTDVSSLEHTVVKGDLTLTGTAQSHMSLTNIEVEGNLDLSGLINNSSIDLSNVTVDGETIF